MGATQSIPTTKIVFEFIRVFFQHACGLGEGAFACACFDK
jgi:hypothetical protein